MRELREIRGGIHKDTEVKDAVRTESSAKVSTLWLVTENQFVAMAGLLAGHALRAEWLALMDLTGDSGL